MRSWSWLSIGSCSSSASLSRLWSFTNRMPVREPLDRYFRVRANWISRDAWANSHQYSPSIFPSAVAAALISCNIWDMLGLLTLPFRQWCSHASSTRKSAKILGSEAQSVSISSRSGPVSLSICADLMASYFSVSAARVLS